MTYKTRLPAIETFEQKDSITKAEHELPMENPYSNSMWSNKSSAFHFDRTEVLKL